jgi:hypothetical protein
LPDAGLELDLAVHGQLARRLAALHGDEPVLARMPGPKGLAKIWMVPSHSRSGRLALAAQQHRPVAGRGTGLLQHLDGQILGRAGLQQLAQRQPQRVFALGRAVGGAQLHQQHCMAPFL